MKKNERKYYKMERNLYIKTLTPRKLLKIAEKRARGEFITVVITTVSRKTGKEEIFDFDRPRFWLESGGKDDKNFVLSFINLRGALERTTGPLCIKLQPNKMKDPQYYDVKKIEVLRHLSWAEIDKLGLK